MQEQPRGRTGARLDEDLAKLRSCSASELRDAMDGVDAEVPKSSRFAIMVFFVGLGVLGVLMGFWASASPGPSPV